MTLEFAGIGFSLGTLTQMRTNVNCSLTGVYQQRASSGFSYLFVAVMTFERNIKNITKTNNLYLEFIIC